MILGFCVGGLAVEIVCRIILSVEKLGQISEGTAFRSEPDDRWGWKLRPGSYREKNSEFDASGFVNRLHMNDGVEYEAEADLNRTRILILGDSHTAAIGAGTEETWVRSLQNRLNETSQTDSFRCYNAAAPGYSVHQYLTRLIDQGPIVKPHYVVVGFSFATDLYDLLPPDRGGWMYGGDDSRVYYDLGDDNQLLEKYWARSDDVVPRTGNVAGLARGFLKHFATFAVLRHSNFALSIGSKLSLRGQSLWPSMEVVVRRETGDDFRYQWDLAKAILGRMDQEAERLGAELIIVGIPYLPQLYDEIWKSTFGGNEAYDRTVAIERLSEWCDEREIPYVDTLAPLASAVAENGRWLHHRRDAHPTPEGHEIIAEAVFRSHSIGAPEPPAGPDER